jgi:hypothetical protein
MSYALLVSETSSYLGIAKEFMERRMKAAQTVTET